ncbi:MAG: DUF1837 domain-containing protein [Clostridia bacterium]|nr:DUF1837 domain-containing protein [Clostridia bacterium]
MGKRIFDTKHIIISKIQEDDLNSFLIDLDIDDNGNPLYQLNEFAQAVINTIPEYVFAQYEDPSITQINAVEKLREAAKSIYKIRDYELMRRWYLERDQSVQEDINTMGKSRRGEFGELILHLLLRDFKHTIPLVSKVYFKDSAGVPAHGFDAVHITPDDGILWLGESKFYTDSKDGIKALTDDLLNHFTREYLNEQFIIIKKNLGNNSIPQRDEWIEKLTQCNKLRDKINTINIPLLCTYPHDIYNLFNDLNTKEAVEYHDKNIRELKEYFDNNNKHPLKAQLNIILLLFPIRDKEELIIKLHEKLWHMQNM